MKGSGKQTTGRTAARTRSTAPARRSEPAGLLSLQRAVGNRAVRGLLSAQGETASPRVSRVLASPGRPLDSAQQRDMQRRLGHDFSHVRVHTDTAAGQSAADVNANAYTVGRHMVFAPGKYAPHTAEGSRLLAHELVHTLQQRGGSAAGSLRVSAPSDSHEAEADRIARDVGQRAAVNPVRVTPTGMHLAREAAPGGQGGVLHQRLTLVRNLLVLTGNQLTLIGLVDDGVIIEIKLGDGSSSLFAVSNPWITERDDRFGRVPTVSMFRDSSRWEIDYLGEGPGANQTKSRIVLGASQTAGEMAMALHRARRNKAWQGWDAKALDDSIERKDTAAARADYIKSRVSSAAQRNTEQTELRTALKRWGATFNDALALEGEYPELYAKEWDQRRAERDRKDAEWAQQHPEEVKQQQFRAGIKALAVLVNKTDPNGPDADKVIELVDAFLPLLDGAELTLFINDANEGLEKLLGPFGFRTVFGVNVGGLQNDRLEYALGNFAVLTRAQRVQLRRSPLAVGQHGIQTWPTAAELAAEGRLVAIRKLPDGSLHVGPLSEFNQAVEQSRINHALGQLEAIRNAGPAALFGRIVGGEKGAAIGAMVDAGLAIRGTMKARRAVRTQMDNMSSGGHLVTREPLGRLPIVERAQPRTPAPRPRTAQTGDVAASKAAKDLFVEGADPARIKGQRIKPGNLRRELMKSEIGRETLEIIERKDLDVILNYNKDMALEKPGGILYGVSYDNVAIVYVYRTQSVQKTAETVIHEVTHNAGIRGSQRAEIIAEIRAAKHTGPVSNGDIRRIIERIKKDYPELPYRILSPRVGAH